MNGLRKFSLKFFSTRALLTIILFTVTWVSTAQRIPAKQIDTLLTKKPDTLKAPIAPQPDFGDTIVSSDTVPANDSATVQKIDTFSLKLSKDTLSAPLQYYAEDSVVVMIKNKKIFGIRPIL